MVCLWGKWQKAVFSIQKPTKGRVCWIGLQNLKPLQASLKYFCTRKDVALQKPWTYTNWSTVISEHGSFQWRLIIKSTCHIQWRDPHCFFPPSAFGGHLASLLLSYSSKIPLRQYLPTKISFQIKSKLLALEAVNTATNDKGCQHARVNTTNSENKTICLHLKLI